MKEAFVHEELDHQQRHGLVENLEYQEYVVRLAMNQVVSQMRDFQSFPKQENQLGSVEWEQMLWEILLDCQQKCEDQEQCCEVKNLHQYSGYEVMGSQLP